MKEKKKKKAKPHHQQPINLRKITQQKQDVGLKDSRIQEVFLYALGIGRDSWGVL